MVSRKQLASVKEANLRQTWQFVSNRLGPGGLIFTDYRNFSNSGSIRI